MREFVASRSCWSTSGQSMLRSTWLESEIEFSRVAMMSRRGTYPALPAKLQESSDSHTACRPHHPVRQLSRRGLPAYRGARAVWKQMVQTHPGLGKSGSSIDYSFALLRFSVVVDLFLGDS